MLFRNKLTVLVSLLGMMMIQMSSTQAKIVDTGEVLQSADRTRIVRTLERKDVQEQLADMGVDPASAIERVNQMTDAEIAQINGQLTDLPAGAGLSTVELLLIIVILILVL
jgi:Skp family chaperone for outer membrane proteins